MLDALRAQEEDIKLFYYQNCLLYILTQSRIKIVHTNVGVTVDIVPGL